MNHRIEKTVPIRIRRETASSKRDTQTPKQASGALNGAHSTTRREPTGGERVRQTAKPVNGAHSSTRHEPANSKRNTQTNKEASVKNRTFPPKQGKQGKGKL